MNEIDIKDTIKDKDSPFNIKIFSLSGLGKDFCIKTIDVGSGSTSKTIIEAKEKDELKGKKVIFEKSKLIKKFEAVKNIIDSDDKHEINSFFGRQAWLNDKYNIFHATFKFNPYNYIKKIEEISGFLNYYYSYSKNIIFIPNIVKNITPYDEDGNKKEKIEIINIEQYKTLIDELYIFFQKMNNKPIFVPISLKFSINDIKDLIIYYLRKERYYFWIDFEALPIDESVSALIREINLILRESNYFDKCIVFVTNIKREIISHSKADKSPASDILGTLCGANFVGVSREPAKRIDMPENIEKLKKLREHKARIFDPNTYYYNKLKDKIIKKPENITNNSIILSQEFGKQKEYFLKNINIKDYLNKKDMINDYHKGKILKEFALKDTPQRRLV